MVILGMWVRRHTLIVKGKRRQLSTNADRNQNQLMREPGLHISYSESCIQTAQILHRMVEKQQLFDSVFVDSMAEGISADTKKPSSLDLIIASFFERSFNQEPLDPIEYAGMDILS